MYAFSAVPEKAAASTVFAATDPDVPKKYHDKYVTRKGTGVAIDEWTGLALDEDLRKQLWTTAEKIVEEKLGTAPAPAPAP